MTRVKADGRPMKVHYVTMLFPAAAETFACNDVITLKNLGIDVSVHSFRFPGGNTGSLALERGLGDLPTTYNSFRNTFRGILTAFTRPSLSVPAACWICRHTFRKPGHFLKSFVLLPRALQLFTEIEREKPDIVHLFWGHYPSILGYMVKERLEGTRLSISLGAYDLGISYGGSRALIEKADLITTFAKANIDDLLRLGAPSGKIKLVYRGLDFEKYESWTAGIPKTGRKIVTAGRLIPGKGMRDALSVFAGIKKKWPDSSLAVLGDGPLMGDLKKFAASLGVENAAVFFGHVKHIDVLKEMKSAEVFLFMSGYRHERLPNVVKEAVFCGCLAVAGYTPGIDELIPDDNHGFVVEPGDISGTREKIETFFREPEKFEKIIDNAYNHLIENFSIKTEMKKLIDHWAEILK